MTATAHRDKRSHFLAFLSAVHPCPSGKKGCTGPVCNLYSTPYRYRFATSFATAIGVNTYHPLTETNAAIFCISFCCSTRRSFKLSHPMTATGASLLGSGLSSSACGDKGTREGKHMRQSLALQVHCWGHLGHHAVDGSNTKSPG